MLTDVKNAKYTADTDFRLSFHSEIRSEIHIKVNILWINQKSYCS